MTEIISKSLGPDGAEISVQTDNHETAGSVTVTQRGGRCKIGLLQVKPNFRGQHLGAILLEGAEKWAEQKDLQEIYGKLEPVSGNEAALLAILKSRGYSVNFKTGIVRKKF